MGMLKEKKAANRSERDPCRNLSRRVLALVRDCAERVQIVLGNAINQTYTRNCGLQSECES